MQEVPRSIRGATITTYDVHETVGVTSGYQRCAVKRRRPQRRQPHPRASDLLARSRLEQCLRLAEIRRVEALGERFVDGRQHLANETLTALRAVEAPERDR